MARESKKLVTLWYVHTHRGYVFNHIEDGINENDRPEPKSEKQQIWRDQQWLRAFGVLSDNEITQKTLTWNT